MRIGDRIRIRRFSRMDGEKQVARLEKSRWPQDRAILVYAAEHGGTDRVRSWAVHGLPYPEEREELARIASGHPDCYTRRSALRKLQYPEDRRTLLAVAENDPDLSTAEEAVKKLPWPEEREQLLAMARGRRVPVAAIRQMDGREAREELEDMVLHSEDKSVRHAAIEQLDAELSREMLERFIMTRKPGSQDRWEAVKKLRWPESREVLVHLVRTDPDDDIRAAALRALPWPEEEEIIRAVAGEPLKRVGKEFKNISVKAAAIRTMANAGVCVNCGGEMREKTEELYEMWGDYDYATHYVTSWVCQQCGLTLKKCEV